MSDTTQQQIDETIVQATVSLLRDVGSNFTIEQLARESGLSRATIYRRVGSKEALLQRIAHERALMSRPVPMYASESCTRSGRP